MNLDTLAKLSERYTTEQLIVSADRCLNSRFKQIDCRVCVEACPAEAIQLEAGQAAINAETCVRCGACVWQCPTEVFAQSPGLKSKLPETVQAVGAASARTAPRSGTCVELRCSQVKGDKTSVPDATIIQHPRCLAELSPAQLIELAAERDVWLNDQACAACPLKEAHTSIMRAVNEANRWRAAFDQPRHIHPLTTDADRNAKPRAARVFDSANPPSDRRAFFKLFTRSLVEASASAAKSNDTDQVRPAIPPLRGHGKPVDQRLPRHVPAERARLLSVIEKWGQPQRVPLDLPRVQVKELDCTACGLCAKFCPTGALRFQSDETYFVLDFIPAACVDCGICAKACPTQEVSLTHDLPLLEFIGIKAQVLVAGNLAPCAMCQKPTASH
ncbi:partial NADH-quinone oxidoreductase subunit I, partial [Thermoflexales bacterium]